MSKNTIGFLTHPLQSYQFCPSADGLWLGVILTVSATPPLSFAIPYESLDRLLLEIQRVRDTCRDRQRSRV